MGDVSLEPTKAQRVTERLKVFFSLLYSLLTMKKFTSPGKDYTCHDDNSLSESGAEIFLYSTYTQETDSWRFISQTFLFILNKFKFRLRFILSMRL